MQPIIYTPFHNSFIIEPKVPLCATDEILTFLHQVCTDETVLPYHARMAFEELAAVPKTADSNRKIANSIRVSYARLSRLKQKQFLNLLTLALDVWEAKKKIKAEELEFFTNGAESKTA